MEGEEHSVRATWRPSGDTHRERIMSLDEEGEGVEEEEEDEEENAEVVETGSFWQGIVVLKSSLFS